MALSDCEAIFTRTYDRMIAAGRTVAEAGLAAQTAMQACLQQSTTPVTQPFTPVSGTRLPDLGPTHKR